MISLFESAAQCPNDVPKLGSEATAPYLQLCHSGANTCPTVPAPTVVPGSGLAQEATISATVPTSMTAQRIHWYAEYEATPGAGDWVPLWGDDGAIMIEGGPYSPGATVEFGASGLVHDRKSRFAVAFCDLNRCRCRSAWIDQSATALVLDAPDPPQHGYAEVDDTFTRPTTEFPGNGIGPNQIWMSNTRIVDGNDAGAEGDAVELPSTSIAIRQQDSGRAHVYAEALIRNDRSTTSELYGPNEYNFDVFARDFDVINGTDTFRKAFYVKLVHEFADPTGAIYNGHPTLIIGRVSQLGNTDVRCVHLPGNVSTPAPNCITITQPAGCPADGILPLASDDSAEPGKSQPVWLRIEVSDEAGESVVVGTVAWNCSSGGIEGCANRCTTGEFRDSLDLEEMSGKEGRSGMCSHHKMHFADRFRQGSVDPAGP